MQRIQAEIKHRVEQHVKVYLKLSNDGTRWELDAPIFDDGYPLDGLSGGPSPQESDCECDDPDGCRNAHTAAAWLDLPNATQLFALLKDYFL